MQANKLITLFHAERGRFFLWSPVAMMIGVSAYFSLENEPPVAYGIIPLATCAALLALSWRYPVRWLATYIFLVSLGFAAAQWRTHVVATPLLGRELHNIVVEGTIDEIDPVEQKEKLVLSHPVIEDVPSADTPQRVRVSFHHQDPDLHVGDRVRLNANLYPLPAPAMPGSYDFARHFYFRSIGATGFAMREPVVISSDQRLSISNGLNNLRHAIGENMRAGMPGVAGTVAAAMTVGETGAIPEDTKTALRNSGLAHMLAIAGLHLGIVTGIVFFNVRLLLTLYPPLALRLPVKKISAVCALISAFIYLLLAGFPIPAQRAFIMVAFLFMAILFDRRGITLRTLAIAALAILLLFPESMFGASFQMSFAATLAIVSIYERFGRNLYRPGDSWLRRAGYHILGIVITSLAATLSTAPFVLYHFNRFAIFGLISNMIVVPLATFVIMPGMVLSLLLMPLGLQWIGYVPLEYGTAMMLSLAAWVTSLPYASLHLPSPTDAGLVLAAFGLLWLCLMTQRWRLLGLPVIAIGLATIALHEPVDVLVSDDARQLMARLDDGRYTTLKGTGRAFTVQDWLRAEGQEDIVPLKESGIECDKTYCLYQKNGRSLLMVKKPSDDEVLDKACAQKTDMLVAWRYLHPDHCSGPAQLIGRAELEQYGALAIWLDKSGIRVAHTRKDGQARRPWQPVRAQEPSEDD